MIIRRGAELRVNMGNYEHVVLTAQVEIERDDNSFDRTDPLKEAQVLLERALMEDISKIKESTGLDPKESFIHHWKQETE